MDEWGQADALNIGEMEAAVEYDVGYTDSEAEGLSMRRLKKIKKPLFPSSKDIIFHKQNLSRSGRPWQWGSTAGTSCPRAR